MIKKKILKVDSRDKHFHQFGSTTTFEPESSFGVGVEQLIEKPSEVDCTAISTVKIAESKDKKKYSVSHLWDLTPHSAQGADPRDTLTTAVKNGLVQFENGMVDKIWQGYYRADTGNLGSAFDNIRSAMTINGSSCTLASNFYNNWLGVQPNGIVPQGDYVISEHDYVFLDWVVLNGVTYALVDFHLGYNVYMPQEVLNAEMAKDGCGAWIGSDKVGLLTQTRNLLEWLADLYANLILALKRVKTTNPTPISPSVGSIPPYPTKVVAFCNAVAVYEGGNPIRKNPGNIRCSPLNRTNWNHLAISEENGFCVFPSFTVGMQALQEKVYNACTGKSKVYFPTDTIAQFFAKYAPSGDDNNPDAYAQFIAKRIGVTIDTKMSDLLL